MTFYINGRKRQELSETIEQCQKKSQNVVNGRDDGHRTLFVPTDDKIKNKTSSQIHSLSARNFAQIESEKLYIEKVSCLKLLNFSCISP